MDYNIRKSGDVKNIRLPIRSFKENNKKIVRSSEETTTNDNFSENKSKLSDKSKKPINKTIKRPINNTSIKPNSRKRISTGPEEIRVRKPKNRKLTHFSGNFKNALNTYKLGLRSVFLLSKVINLGL